MRKTFVLLAIVAFGAFFGCQKQQTEEERNAQIEREVQNRLAAEQQKQKEQELAQREADLDARQKQLADNQAAATQGEASSTPARPRRDVSSTRERPASYDLFYTRLEPYGSWLETSDYGYVWQPREGRSSNWRPYSNGHWVYTDAGWTWVSEELFGWATYHYGRWTRLRNTGWIWVPGDEWAPAWVSWRKSDDYVGWAPLPPEAQFDRRIGIHNWADNYYDIGPTQYCFVASRDFGSPRVEQTIVPPAQNLSIINRTTNVTNITYNNVTIVNQGPNYDELRSRTQQQIPRLRLERRIILDSPGQQPAPVVRGEVIEMTAPMVAKAQTAERPREVRQTISRAEVDHGWANVGDSDAARQVRQKIKAEATAPPDAPPKTFTKATTAAAATTTQASPTSSAGQAAEGSSPPASKATISPAATPVATPSNTVSRRTESPSATASPIGTARSASPTGTRIPTEGLTHSPTTAPRVTAPSELSPAPSATASFSPRHMATPSPSPSASPTSTAAEASPRVGAPVKRDSTRLPPSPIEPPQSPVSQPQTAPSASPSGTPVSGESAVTPLERGRQSANQGEQRGRGRAFERSRQRPGASSTEVSAPPSPSGTPTATPFAPSPLEQRRDRDNRGRHGSQSEAISPSPTPSPSATP